MQNKRILARCATLVAIVSLFAIGYFFLGIYNRNKVVVISMWPIGRRVGNWNMVLIYWKQIVGLF